jgi:hypothetical protein
MVRRLVLALAVVAVMTAALAGAPPATPLIGGESLLISEATAAQPGAPDYCGPWQQSWFVSSGGWWYFWWWRWCHNPSIQGGWYVDWAGWHWFGPAPPFLPPGFHYVGGPPS